MWMSISIISVLVNITFLLYVRWLLINFKVLGSEIQNASLLVGEYTEHVESIYELEMFYGDETLKGMVEHGQELIKTLNEIDFILNQEEEGEDDEDSEETN
jgi:hypothetical protein